MTGYKAKKLQATEKSGVLRQFWEISEELCFPSSTMIIGGKELPGCLWKTKVDWDFILQLLFN